MATAEEKHVLRSISFNAQAGIIICTKCQHGMDNLKSLRSHLSVSKHLESRDVRLCAKGIRAVLLKGTIWEKEVEQIATLPRCFGGSYMSDSQLQYQNAPQNTSDHLLRVKDLQVKFGYVCLNCTSFCSKMEHDMVQHLVENHEYLKDLALQEVYNMTTVPIQSLGQGSKERYFPVFVPDIQELRGNASKSKESIAVVDTSDLMEMLSAPLQNKTPLDVLPDYLDAVQSEENENAFCDIYDPLIITESILNNQVPEASLAVALDPSKGLHLHEEIDEDPNKKIQAAFESILSSLDPDKKGREGAQDFDKDYEDVPLHSLAGDMRKEVSQVLKRSGFPGILERSGFPTLGSVATAICFPANRMASAMRTYLETIGKQGTGQRFKNSAGKDWRMGKANAPLIKFLAKSGDPSLSDENTNLTSQDHSLVVGLEEKIHTNMISYLRAAAVVTNSAPNFIRSMVIAHNGVFSTVATRRGSHAGKARSARRVDAGVSTTDECASGSVPLSGASFFKVLTTNKSVVSYANDICRLIIMAVRVFLVDRHLSKSSDRRRSVEDEALSQSLGHLLNDCPIFQGAVKTCLCSMGCCLHERNSLSSSVSISPCFKILATSESSVISQGEAHTVKVEGCVSKFSAEHIGIHWILRALLLFESAERNMVDCLFVSKFMSVVSVEDPTDIVKQRRFRDAHLLTPTTASLAYAMKCCGVVEMCRNLSDWTNLLSIGIAASSSEERTITQNGERNYGQDCGSRAQNLPDWLLTKEQVSRCFSVSHNTVASYLVGVHNALRACTDANSDMHVRFVECAKPQHVGGRCALVDGKECSLDDLGNAVKQWHREAQKILFEKLLLGMKLPDGFDNMLNLLEDDFRDNRRGHCFASLRANSDWGRECSVAVLKHILKDKRLRTKFFGAINFRRDLPAPGDLENLDMVKEQLQCYLNDSQELQKLLLAALHVSGGGPARSTELSYLLKNGAQSRRHVFVLQGDIVFIARYNKNESGRGRGDIIARFPDSKTSKLLLKFFLFVRPLEELFVRYLHGSEAAETQGSYVFAESGKKFSDEKFRCEIVKLFTTAGIPFNFREYRHFQVGMARRHLSKELLITMAEEVEEFMQSNEVCIHPVAGAIAASPFDSVEREASEKQSSAFQNRYPDLCTSFPIHEQAGHTYTTAEKCYGISAVDIEGLGRSRLQKFRLTSRAWHKTLGLNAQASNAVVVGKRFAPTKENYSMSEGKKKVKRDMKVGQKPHTNLHAPERVPSYIAVEHFVNPTAAPLSNHTIPEPISRPQHQAVVRHGQEKVVHANNPGLPTLFMPKDISNMLSALRSMKKNENANFRSMEQFQAVHLMLQMRSDLLIVMPTGYGKTDMILLTSFIEQRQPQVMLSVIIVPLVALSNDLLRRCEEAGIRAGSWESRRNIESLSILIVSVEHVETHEYAVIISEQANKGRLARVEMDECHTTGNWNDFRPSYASLKGNMRPGGIPVQAVLVSATVPPHCANELAEKHGVSQFQEIRIPTVRKNISYAVREVPTSRFKGIEEGLCEFAMKSVEQRVLSWIAAGNNLTEALCAQVILYCPTRRIRRILSSMLTSLTIAGTDIEVFGYDSSLSLEEKKKVLHCWTSFNRCENDGTDSRNLQVGENLPRFQILAGTCAFGMGIDSAFVRYVAHLGYSRSVLEYVQESGRAGRSGSSAWCDLLFSPKLIQRERSIITSVPSEEIEMLRLDATTVANLDSTNRLRRSCELEAFEQWARNSLCCRRQSLFAYMDREKPEICLFEKCSTAQEEKSLCDFCQSVDAKATCHNREVQQITSMGPVSSSFTGDGRPVDTICCPSATPSTETNIPSTAPDLEREVFGSQRDSINRAHAQKELRSFSMLCRELQSLCAVCIITKGIRRTLEECSEDSCTTWRCYRCLQTSHNATDCELIPFRPRDTKSRKFAPKETERPNHCYACGLDRWQRIRMHDRTEFSKISTCPYVAAFRLAAVGWDDEKWKTRIVEKFDLRKLQSLVNPNPGFQDVIFFKWLREEDVHNKKFRLMEVTEFILQGCRSQNMDQLSAMKMDQSWSV